MSWRVVAAKDFRDGLRSRSVVAVTLVFVVSFAGAAYLYGYLAEVNPSMESSTTAFAGLMSGTASFYTTSLVSLMGLMLGYSAVVGERDSGSLKLLLGLPHSRRDAVFGKAVGRGVVLVGSVLAGVVAASLVSLTYEETSAVALAWLGLGTAVLGLAHLSVGLGLSAALNSQSRVTAAVVGYFLANKFLWDSGLLPRLVVYPWGDGLLDTPDWYPYLESLAPNTAFQTVIDGGLNGFDGVGGVALAALAFWVVAPVSLGYLAFERSDI
ncbi:MAG: ABC transporter permease subunit [Halobacteriales archaeon]